MHATIPIKLVHICSSDITVKFLLLNQLHFFKKNGFDVTAVCSKGKWFPSIEESGLKLHCIEIKRYISPFKDLVALFRLMRFMAREKPQIIHTHTPKAALLGLTAAWLCRIRFRFNTIHGFYFSPQKKSIRKKILIGLEKLSGLLSHHTFCQNPIDTEVAIQNKIVARDKITTIGNGVDLKKFHPGVISQSELSLTRKKLNILPGEFVIGIIARLVKEKGYRELAEAFKSIYPRMQAKLIIIGEPDHTKKDVLTAELITQGIPKERVITISFTDEVPLYLSLMDVFVLPSYREGFPRSVIEAEAMGLPVIAAKSNGAMIAVDHEKTGFIVPIGNSSEIAHYILLLCNDRKLKDDIGSNARVKAEKEFNEDDVFKRVLSGYQKFCTLQ